MTEQLFFYIVASGIYLMVIHFAIHIKNEFNIWFMIGIFIFGAVIGHFLNSYLAGFIFASIFTFLFW